MADAFGDNDAMDQGAEGRLSSPQAGKAPPQAGKAADVAADAKPARVPRKKDPKLDLDLLEADGGFNDIWHKMGPAFKASFQGEGHEVADLRRLLELYQRWQMRFYPHCDFDAFVTKLEKAGRSRVVKAKMGSMRQNLLGLIFPPNGPAEDEEPLKCGEATAAAADRVLPSSGADGARAAAAAAAAAAVHPAAGPTAAGGTLGAGGDDADDELVALQREAEWEAAYAAMDMLEMATPPTPREQQQHQQRHSGPTGPAPAAAGTAAASRAKVDDLDMDELMDLADEMHYEPPPPRPAAAAKQSPPQQTHGAQATGSDGESARPYGVGGVDGLAAYDDADEELVALAMGLDVAVQEATAAVAEQRRRLDGRGGADVGGGEEKDQGCGGAGAGAGTAATAAAAPAESEGEKDDVWDGVEDEELRMLAVTDRAEMETITVSPHHGGGGGAGGGSPFAVAAGGGGTAAVAAAPSAMNVDGGPTAELNVRQYGGTEELDAELLALAAAEDDTGATANIGGGDGEGFSCDGREAWGSNAEVPLAAPFGGGGGGGGGSATQLEAALDSQEVGVEPGLLLLRDILITQTESQGEGAEVSHVA